MKKLLVALLAICIVFSSFCVTAFAAEDASATGAATTETKTVESLVGAFYLQGESAAGYMGDGTIVQSEYDYQIADKMAANLNGSKRVPFYAMEKDGSVFFDAFAEQYLISETNAAKKAGIDFFAYKLYMGYDNTSKNLMRNMNSQLIRHVSIFSNAQFESKMNYAVVLDSSFDPGVSYEVDIVLDKFLVMKGYLTAGDGRPVVFIEWNDEIEKMITKINSKLAKAVKYGADPTKTSYPKTNLNDGVEKMFVVALNAPSYADAMAVKDKDGNNLIDAVSWTEGSGKNGEAYATMAASVEANWANGEKVVPNVVTGFDKTLLAGDKAIEVTAKKTNKKNTVADVRYSRSGEADEYVAAATPQELVEHVKKAIATTNKPEQFNAVMIYAWDDFLGGANLCPTKTDKSYQYDTSYITALREYFYGKTEGMASFSVLDPTGNTIVTDENGTYTKTDRDGNVLEKKDKDGNDIAVADPNGSEQQSTEYKFAKFVEDNLVVIIIVAAAVVVAAVVIVVVVVVSKKKKA
jgi:hypothetical protein